MVGHGNLERTGKVREKSGNLKINGFGRQSSENLFIVFKTGKDVHSHEIKPISFLIGGYSYRKECAPLVSKFFPLRVTPKFKAIQLALLK